MRQFKIYIRSVQDVLKFVSIATSRPYDVKVSDNRHQISGKSFMEMFCLNIRQPLTVTLNCGDEEAEAFLTAADRFLVK